MIAFENVSKIFPGGIAAVKELSLEIAEGETLVLLGTSGSGKTTSMKMVNRLVEPTSGRILIDGTDIMERDPVVLRRGIGYAIQHIGLFPHMSVRDNIAVVPRLLHWTEEQIEKSCRDLLNMVGLPAEDFLDRFPEQLSGGQMQRVGVARALAANPPVILMDEPFGALDPITREQLQEEFLRLQSQIRKTVIFVTHDIFEAVRMGDRVALLDAGTVQQLASPAELVENPANEFVDQFLGRHRFQLSLLTKKIARLLEDGVAEKTGPDAAGKKAGEKDHSLHPEDSLVEALDLFKKTALDSLPIRDEGKLVGRLARKQLLSTITETLGAREQ